SATDDWESLQLRFRWPEQADYELIRPVVLFGLPVTDRADQTGVSQRTIARHADRFEAGGFAAVRDPAPSLRLPEDMRQALRELKAEYPSFGLRELATILDVRFGRRVGHHTVARVLAVAPLPSPPVRRFPAYRELATGTERRLAIVRLHTEGWSVQSIAGYLGTSRQTVYTALKRWVAEDFAGLPDKPHTRKRRSLKVDLATLDRACQLQENPLLGEFRLHSALKQRFGIELSPRTCGRILAHNRAVYGLAGPEKQEKTPKPMPFAARFRHQYWTVDLRYIDMHQLDGDPVYCISILENYSRAILASSLSRRQDLSAYLAVLYAALREYGSPTALVSDGGSIFRADRAKAIYTALGIAHTPIERRQPWQSYIETHFGIQRRLGDYYFARAETWVELQRVHDRFVYDFTEQEHWAHQRRADGRRSPAAVLNWVVGTPHDPAALERLFQPVRYGRKLDRSGYVRFRNWRVYGNRALPKRPSMVWLSEETLTVQYGAHPLAYHTVQVNRRGELTAVTEA
ncbi:MAG TPA: helix-turn-helix domain-containing protein, partial [Dehalococcoidia bacterium]|nr:helix-turn-helix domain-containing protein [Dehalococcoidia bacterium]